MPGNTDSPAQRKRRQDAILSAVISSAVQLAVGGLLLFLRFFYGVEGFWGAVLVIVSLLDLGAIIPIWILLKTRLKEIEGGEEDAAAQY